jgi:putative FmdB family regulatory protein
MPIYEYRCRKCHRRVSILSRTFDEAAHVRPRCPYCGHDELDRLVSRVAVLRSEEAQLDSLADSSALSDLDENDPRSVARWMKKMSSEAGEDLGDEFREVVDRLEAGQSPEDIESSMPDLAPPSPDDNL